MLVQVELQKLPNQDASRLFIGGYSQGCQVALACFLTCVQAYPLGGIIGLSGFQRLQIDAESIPQEQLEVMRQTPMFLYHGTADKMINIKHTKLSYEIFKKRIYTGEGKRNFCFFEQEGLGNTLHVDELQMLKAWL